MTIINNLSEQGKSFLTSLLLGIYLDGECYAFALALHKNLKWPLIGLKETHIIRHACVQDPGQENTFFDARGYVNQTELCQPFGTSSKYELVHLEEKDLHAIRPIRNASIIMAQQLAESLWPHLPWKNSRISKIQSFTDELEALSKKHGLWIRSSAPACPILLAQAEGDEGGYTLTPTDNGITYSIDRYLT